MGSNPDVFPGMGRYLSPKMAFESRSTQRREPACLQSQYPEATWEGCVDRTKFIRLRMLARDSQAVAANRELAGHWISP
jgi:hypothetical protein